MSNVNIRRAVENIKSNTTIYTPLVEVIVNSIQAIEAKNIEDGEIYIKVERGDQSDLESGIPDIQSLSIEDNGIGFNNANRQSFDTLYSDLKIKDGGKGFGRFTCLKYFECVDVYSIFEDEITGHKERQFSMGSQHEIIVNEKIKVVKSSDTKTIVYLKKIKEGKSLDKKLKTIARLLVEKLLPYFITESYTCPKIYLSEQDGSDQVLLNDYIKNAASADIKEISLKNNKFDFMLVDSKEEFSVRAFKVYFAKHQKSKISLVAHNREVTSANIQKYIPEFSDDFYDLNEGSKSDQGKNYIIKAYVFGDYLDTHVSLERGGFEFQEISDVMYGISQVQIERGAANITQEAVGDEIKARKEKKKERVEAYVDEVAPWHKSILKDIDLSDLPYSASSEEIEVELQKKKIKRELEIKLEVAALLSEDEKNYSNHAAYQLVNKISETSKNDLIHYIALRRNILEIFKKSLQLDAGGKHLSEGAVHDIVFPRKSDSDSIEFESHNLWLVDERLNFTSFVTSDNPLNGAKSDRPDLMVYGRRVIFRGDNSASNPITIFEFKKPGRDDFVNPSSKEDPIEQIVRYVLNIKNGQCKMPDGRKMNVAENTAFYGYVVCDISAKVEEWLEGQKDFKPMPDRLGWFNWRSNINLYIEVLSWDKVLMDAEMRNKVFFEKLGIQ